MGICSLDNQFEETVSQSKFTKYSNYIVDLIPTTSPTKKSSCKHSYQQIYYCAISGLALRLAPIFIPPMMLSSILLDNYFSSDPFSSIFTIKNVLLVPLMFYPIVVLAAYFYNQNFPVKVISKGVYGRDYKKKKVFLKWKEISYKGITYKRLLPYYQLKSTISNEEILIPTFLKGIKKLALELKAHNIIIENQNITVKENITKEAKNFEPLREGGYIIVTTERFNK